MKEKFYQKLQIVLLFIISLFLGANIYVNNHFSPINFSEILYGIQYGEQGADSSIYLTGVLKVLPVTVFIFVILIIIFKDITFNKKKIVIKNKQIYPFQIKKVYKKVLVSLLTIITIIISLNTIGLFDHLKYSKENSNFIEENYIDPKETSITFNKKKNLVFILVESLETTTFNKENGGKLDYDVTEELSNLLNDNDAVTFYNKTKKEGFNMLEGSSWTTASVVSNLSGVPLKPNFKSNLYSNNKYIKNAYALGDLLKDNGYHNELISSARTSFGGLNDYFKTHGDYKIIDEETLESNGFKMTDERKGKWGFNDKYLFEIAKERLLKLKSEEKPFNMNLITIDTHFIDGFKGDYTTNEYKNDLENVYKTESKLVSDFVYWLKEEDFYKDTTIVIMGDHLAMQNDWLKEKDIKNRYVYNCIIDKDINKNAIKTNGRIPTALDTYPTIVHLLGASIGNDKLGLGTNLFSNKKTLSEAYGIDYVNEQLKKNSDFYNNEILK